MHNPSCLGKRRGGLRDERKSTLHFTSTHIIPRSPHPKVSRVHSPFLCTWTVPHNQSRKLFPPHLYRQVLQKTATEFLLMLPAVQQDHSTSPHPSGLWCRQTTTRGAVRTDYYPFSAAHIILPQARAGPPSRTATQPCDDFHSKTIQCHCKNMSCANTSVTRRGTVSENMDRCLAS